MHRNDDGSRPSEAGPELRPGTHAGDGQPTIGHMGAPAGDLATAGLRDHVASLERQRIALSRHIDEADAVAGEGDDVELSSSISVRSVFAAGDDGEDPPVEESGAVASGSGGQNPGQTSRERAREIARGSGRGGPSGPGAASGPGGRDIHDPGAVSEAPPVSLADPRLGSVLTGRYRLEKLIGKGGMGRVYLATQFPLNRPVAVKILNPEFQQKDPQFVRRFFLEASTAARLTHPNTITVFDYGEAESGELFIVMEFLNGRPLSKVISAEAPFPAERVLHIALQICRALREAHQKGIIHRDLKPGNILLLEEGDDVDFVKVLDFGLVKLFTPPSEARSEDQEPLTPGAHGEGAGELTRAGMFLGSPKYMSPEQIQGNHLDPRTDIYSLGVLMFQMLAGKPPYSGATSVEVIYKHVNHPVPSVADVVPGLEVPEELERLVRQCMSKDRDERFPSMGDLLIRLKEVRRALTGLSSVDLGLSMSQVVYPQDPYLNSGEGSAALSRRPELRGPSQSHSHPGLTSGSGAQYRSGASPLSKSGAGAIPGAELRRPTPLDPMRVSGRGAFPEAAFTDLGADDMTPSSLRRPDAGGNRSARLARAAPILAGSALIFALGALAYVFTGGPLRLGGPVPMAAGAGTGSAPGAGVRREVRVSFASTPPGAEVFEDGARLGATPFARSFADEPSGSHQFVFKLAGYADEVVDERLEEPSVKIHARMRARADEGGKGAAAAPGAGGQPGSGTASGGESEYKENPY